MPLLILGILASALALWLLLTYYEVRQSSELAAQERLWTLARTIGSTLDQTTATRLTTLRRLARDTNIIAALRTPGRNPSLAAQTMLYGAVPRNDTITKIRLWTNEGRPICSPQLEMSRDRQLAQTEAALAATRSDSGGGGPLFASDRRVSYWLIVPVRDQGQPIGFVAEERRLSANPQGVRSLSDILGQDIKLSFHNADNSVWTHLTGDTIVPPTVVDSVDSLVVYQGENGRFLSADHPVPQTPIVMSTQMPYSTVLGRAQQIMRVLVVFAVLLTAAGAVAAWLISRSLARPLVELTGAAEALAHGEYGRRVHDIGSDEIGRLALAFNGMADKVQLSHESSARALRREEFLGQASRLLSSSFSDDTLIADLVRFCVPRMADFCSIYVVGDQGVIRRVETAHYDPSKEPVLQALVSHYPIRLDGTNEIATVIRTQQPMLLPTFDRAQYKAAAPDPEAARLLDEVGSTSYMCVPLVARGRTFGAISFTMTDSGRRFTGDDLAVASELARRTAVAIDNAMIYRRSLALRLEAEAASQAKSDFLAKMSHEIRTPINAMMGYAELLEMGLSGPVSESQRGQLGRIRTSGEHLTSLVSEILDLAKIEAGRMDIDPVCAVASEAADVALSLIRPQAMNKGVQIAVRAEGDLTAKYLGDPQRVQQIVANLLSNAVKFTGPGGTIQVRCANGGRPGLGEEWTSVVVQDSGVGISPADQERIFQPFVQVENGYTRSHGGTGLGLTISRSLAQMMGGDLTVESTPGAGSCFTLWLPAPNSCTDEG
jgi:signal transduction histidine kinase